MQNEAILIVTNPPSSFDFGIDCMNYETGPEFRGIHTIPAGLHFIYHGTGMGARQGFFARLKKREIRVTSWDPSNEEISVKPFLSESAIENLIGGVYRGELNSNLGPYPLPQHNTWINLSGFISDSVLVRADIPCDCVIFPGSASDERIGIPKLDAVQPYFPGLARVARFAAIVQIEKRLRLEISQNAGDAREAITNHEMDKSLLLEAIVRECFGGSYDELLGEIQLSFLLFMLIYSEDALEQWKALVNLLCKCEGAILSKPIFYATFLRVLYEQLKYSPDDFFHTELSHENFLRPVMSNLFQILNSPAIPASLLEHRKRLLNFMRKKFDLFDDQFLDSHFNGRNSSSHVFLSDEMYNLVGDDMPVVVEESDVIEISASTKPADVIGISEAAESYPSLSVSTPYTEADKFSWRYPALFDSLAKSSEVGRYAEDMTMAAVRIVELGRMSEDDGASLDPEFRRALMEARMFIECEVALMSR